MCSPSQQLKQKPPGSTRTQWSHQGSTKTPVDGKGPGPTKARNKAAEPRPGTASGTGPATQPADSKKHYRMFSM